MNSLILLLADRSDWKRLGDAFNDKAAKLSTQDFLCLMGVFAGMVFLFSILYEYSRREDNHRTYSKPKKLFSELCQVHRLGWQQQKLLLKLAKHWQLANPSLLFVRPESFQINQLTGDLQNCADELETLRARLFDSQQGRH